MARRIRLVWALLAVCVLAASCTEGDRSSDDSGITVAKLELPALSGDATVDNLVERSAPVRGEVLNNIDETLQTYLYDLPSGDYGTDEAVVLELDVWLRASGTKPSFNSKMGATYQTTDSATEIISRLKSASFEGFVFQDTAQKDGKALVGGSDITDTEIAFRSKDMPIRSLSFFVKQDSSQPDVREIGVLFSSDLEEQQQLDKFFQNFSGWAGELPLMEGGEFSDLRVNFTYNNLAALSGLASGNTSTASHPADFSLTYKYKPNGRTVEQLKDDAQTVAIDAGWQIPNETLEYIERNDTSFRISRAAGPSGDTEKLKYQISESVPL